MSNKTIKVLAVDDESAIREMIRFTLSRSGMDVEGAADARSALVSISQRRPDIILMDWMMPGISGLDLTRRLRREPATAKIPIIMLTARLTEDDKVAGLDAGTDDYILKPFSPRELIARINAVVRRSGAAGDDGRITAGSLVLDTVSRQATSDGNTVALGPTEYRLLEFFISHPGRAFSRGQIMDHVWDFEFDGTSNIIDVYVRYLRTKIDRPFGHDSIETVRGVGYRLREPEPDVS